MHAQSAPPPTPKLTPDHTLLLQRLEKLLVENPESTQAVEMLKQRAVWERLPLDQALRWARLAQAAGLPEVSLEVLGHITEAFPDFPEARQERLELLKTLELEEGFRATSTRSEGSDPAAATREQWRSAASCSAAARSTAGAAEADIEAPFFNLRREEALLRRYLELFRGREDCFARQWVDRQAGTQGYIPVRRPLEAMDVLEHVRGHRTYGIYLLQSDSRVRLAVVDCDLAQRLRGATVSAKDREQVQREKSYLLQRLPELGRERGLPSLVEFSGGKGFHFWVFFAGPVDAAAARQALQQVVKMIAPDLSCFNLEVFPKQDRLAGKGLGNLVKLPLGIHRASGKPSYFIQVHDRSLQAQLAVLERVRPIPVKTLTEFAGMGQKAEVVIHPRQRAWADKYPELALLGEKCIAIGQIIATCRQTRTLSIREEKILLATIGFLPRARTLVHHVFSQLPEYNPHLVDYKLSRLRGTPLGCKRIHGLLGLSGDHCEFSCAAAYPHPLLHWPQWRDQPPAARAETITNLADALQNLREAIEIANRFLAPKPAR